MVHIIYLINRKTSKTANRIRFAVFNSKSFIFVRQNTNIMEITIKIDKRSKQAKMFYEYLKTLPFVEIEETKKDNKTKSSYNPEFVKQVLQAEKDIEKGDFVEIKDVNNIWADILSE